MVGPAGRDGMRVARPGPTVAEAARRGPAPYAGAVAYAWRMNELTVPSYVLNDGSDLPAVGFGTYGLRGSGGVDAMVSAVRTGYRLLDSAFNYENEGILGEAARRCGVPREELRLVSKLPGRCQHYDRAVATVEESLLRAGLDYWDMYLIHWPNPGRGLYVEAFGALVDLHKRGLIRSVGVCNFLPEHIERVRDEVGVLPSVNQIELHPYFPQADALAYHASVGVRTQSWSPQTQGRRGSGDHRPGGRGGGQPRAARPAVALPAGHHPPAQVGDSVAPGREPRYLRLLPHRGADGEDLGPRAPGRAPGGPGPGPLRGVLSHCPSSATLYTLVSRWTNPARR